MSSRTRMSSTAAALLGLVVLFATPASAAEVVLRFGSINTENTAPYDQVLVPFAKAVEEESGGRIEVALKPLGGYGKPAELFTMVEKGAIEMAASVQGYHPGRFPQSSVMELPFMFDNSIAGTSAMMSLYKEGLLDKDYASVKVLGLYVLPPYPIFTTGKKIQSVKDFRGLRMRTPSTTVGVALAKLGAVPLGIPLNMIGDTIASGYVDAIAYGWDSTTTTKGTAGKVLADQLNVVIDARLAAPALDDRHESRHVGCDARRSQEDHRKARFRYRDGQRAHPRSAGSRQQEEAAERSALHRADLQRRSSAPNCSVVTAPAVAEWKANMAKLGIDGERLYTRARELIQQYKVATK